MIAFFFFLVLLMEDINVKLMFFFFFKLSMEDIYVRFNVNLLIVNIFYHIFIM